MSDITMPEPVGVADADALLERIFLAGLGAFDLFAIALGDRLGYYRMLAEKGPATSSELASATNMNERYTREWLEQQAVSGILSVSSVEASAKDRTYSLPEPYHQVLADPTSLSAGVPIAKMVLGSVAPYEQLVSAFQSGDGIAFEDYGIELREGQAGMNRPQFHHFLASDWMPAMPDIHARLSSGNPARIADIGMGAGWSSIAFARAFPNAEVHGFDLDEASVELARKNAEEEGLSDRITFEVRDAGDPDLAGQYDLVTAFECVHDLSNPVAVLRSMRQLVGPGGTVLIMDERVAEAFTAPGDEVERFMYGFSFLHCLPVGMVEKPSAQTGTVMRSDTFRGYAKAAGYSDVQVLPIDNDFFRFYRLTA